jgi:hypothetical protein
MADLDPALIEKAAREIFEFDDVLQTPAHEPWEQMFWDELSDDARVNYCSRASVALLSLGIPAAALNALVRGEAKIWPVEPTREMWAAGANVVVDRRRLHHDTVIKRVITAMDAASPYAAKE